MVDIVLKRSLFLIIFPSLVLTNIELTKHYTFNRSEKKEKQQAESITHIYLHASVSFQLVYIQIHTYI